MGTGFYLEIVGQDSTVRRAALPEGRLIVGRSPARCQVVIEDGRVSRVHLQVAHNPDHGVIVQDLHSANGTLLEGRPIPPGTPIHWLLDQVVTIGSTRLALRYSQPEAGSGDAK